VSGGRAEPDHLVVGRVVKPHGTKGELFVWPMTDRPEDVFGPGRELRLGDEDGGMDGDAAVLEIERSRPFKRGLLVMFAGVSDRDAVGGLANRCLLAPRTALTGPAEDETYYHDLIGLSVETVDGDAVGRIVGVYETAPADLLEVEAEDGRRRLIPLSKQVVRRVDVAEGRLLIEPPPGLLDL
jgi:16S rRNA processing protein RimM